MSIQTEKQMLIFQLMAYHGCYKEDLEGKNIKQLKKMMETYECV